jgi:hypothetical protein
MIFVALYVSIIVLVNVLFGQQSQAWHLAANVIVGAGFIIRDFAQRRVGDRVLLATAVGVGVSFAMSPPGVALASAVAFALSETVDWYVVRRLESRSMLRRVLTSHLFSVPLDSAVFLAGLAYGIGLPWSWVGFATMTGFKFLALGALVFLREKPKAKINISPWLRYHTAVCGCLTQALYTVVSLNPGSVYLCGGINGLSDADCRDWRAIASEALAARGIRVLDPMVRDYRGREDECVNEIVEGDKADIRQSDILLVNACRPSWGTAMEIMLAYSAGKKVVSFVEIG